MTSKNSEIFDNHSAVSFEQFFFACHISVLHFYHFVNDNIFLPFSVINHSVQFYNISYDALKQKKKTTYFMTNNWLL